MIKISNIYIDNLTLKDAIKKIELFLVEKQNKIVVTPNADHIVQLQNDKLFCEIYKSADLILADGMPLIWASKFLNTPLKEKISGSDLFPELCRVSAIKGYKLFFMGGREGAAQLSSEKFKSIYPNIKIIGTYCPPYGFENNPAENEKILNIIKGVEPDILFVGLGAPKQEKWIYKYKDQYQVPVSIGIGGSFEFEAGLVERAPKWMQYNGLEWLWRLLKEPKRLWKRYLVDDMKFFYLVLNQKMRMN
ncbi:MAG: WecB/TagA/CpsF family glycosyltransferase [Thermodesulfobacteriota bacterium]|nr:WecB/TagA/CpsF family glycosyltransferase [Thermodesulfobacteriota bacterium]